MQCRYPGSIAGQQLIPHWTVAPWLSSITTGSSIDRVLAKPWDAPKIRPLSKPYPDMIAQLWEGNPDTRAIGDLVRIVPDGKILEIDSAVSVKTAGEDIAKKLAALGVAKK